MSELIFHHYRDNYNKDYKKNNREFFEDTLSKMDSVFQQYRNPNDFLCVGNKKGVENSVMITGTKDALIFSHEDPYIKYQIRVNKSGELTAYANGFEVLPTERDRILNEHKRRLRECANIDENSTLSGGVSPYILGLKILENPKLIKEIYVSSFHTLKYEKESFNKRILEPIIWGASASTLSLGNSPDGGHAVSLFVDHETKEVKIVDPSGAYFWNSDSFLFDINKDGKKEFYTLKIDKAGVQKEQTCYLQAATMSAIVGKRVQNRKNKLAVLENMKKEALEKGENNRIYQLEKNIIIAKERLAEAVEFPINPSLKPIPHFLNRTQERINLLEKRRRTNGDNDNEIQKEIDRVNRQTNERLNLYAKYLATKNISILNNDGTINLSAAQKQLEIDYKVQAERNRKIVAREAGNTVGEDHSKKHDGLTEYVIYTKDSKNKPAKFSYFSPTANKQPTLDDFKKLYGNQITYDSANPPKVIKSGFLLEKFSKFNKENKSIKYEGIDEDKILKNLVNSRQEDSVRNLKTIPNELPSKKYIEEETNLVRQQKNVAEIQTPKQIQTPNQNIAEIQTPKQIQTPNQNIQTPNPQTQDPYTLYQAKMQQYIQMCQMIYQIRMQQYIQSCRMRMEQCIQQNLKMVNNLANQQQNQQSKGNSGRML
ncbi:MAG: hypothetical protein Ta2D_02470 [Rickettsiales bacterium]|nr:MAG: hypothetical protein Ta2D_02470 [Rickettsiales bacterium]